MKLTQRKIAELVHKGVLKRELDGSYVEAKSPAPNPIEAAPPAPIDNTKSKKTWKVHGFTRDYDGYITSVKISET